jgi:predicted nuclease with RNAse H fold
LTSGCRGVIAGNKVKMRNFLVAGVDLAGVPHRPTGMCLLKGLRAKTSLLYSDEDILSCIQKEKPDLVVVDAPLTLPPGRKSIDERTKSHLRPCDQELKRRRIPFFPITLGPMRGLTKRGIGLRGLLEADGFRVLEVYPGGAQDIWQIPRVKHNLSGLREGLKKLGISGLKKESSGHELDAATGALVGLLFLQGKAEVYGDFTQGAILMPSSSRRR